jgi:hypothetical protein
MGDGPLVFSIGACDDGQLRAERTSHGNA